MPPKIDIAYGFGSWDMTVRVWDRDQMEDAYVWDIRAGELTSLISNAHDGAIRLFNPGLKDNFHVTVKEYLVFSVRCSSSRKIMWLVVISVTMYIYYYGIAHLLVRAFLLLRVCLGTRIE
ncbi:hypothetical protein ACJX0J_041254 [Zea mays]